MKPVKLMENVKAAKMENFWKMVIVWIVITQNVEPVKFKRKIVSLDVIITAKLVIWKENAYHVLMVDFLKMDNAKNVITPSVVLVKIKLILA